LRLDTAKAPECLQRAYAAVQKIDSPNPAVSKQASFAEYLKAQGGPTVGRRAAIQIAAREITVQGRYGAYTAAKPVGVYCISQPHAVYEGVHYRWEISRPGASAGVAFDVPRLV
jgi:hypothetical protein